MKIEEKCSPGRPRRVENEGLEPSGALPGAMWAPGGRQEGSKWLQGASEVSFLGDFGRLLKALLGCF